MTYSNRQDGDGSGVFMTDIAGVPHAVLRRSLALVSVWTVPILKTPAILFGLEPSALEGGNLNLQRLEHHEAAERAPAPVWHPTAPS